LLSLLFYNNWGRNSQYNCEHQDEFHDLYSSPNIIRHDKSRTTIWAGHMARMGEKYAQGFSCDTLTIEIA